MNREAEVLPNKNFQVVPIGYIRNTDEGIFLEILEPYIPALMLLEHFSHVQVLWWAHKHDNEKSRSFTQTEPPYAEGHITGIFATRAEYRPNPIALTTVKLLDIDHEKGIVKIVNIDALDRSPILDLKAYYLVCDRVKDFSVPEWVADWPEWLPEEGLGL